MEMRVFLKKILIASFIALFVFTANANAGFYRTIDDVLANLIKHMEEKGLMHDEEALSAAKFLEDNLIIQRHKMFTVLNQVCKGDIAKLCDENLQKEQKSKCLSDNYKDVSKSCKYHIKKIFSYPEGEVNYNNIKKVTLPE